MRTLNFRDYVLWPIAYKLGLDPATNFEEIQSKAIGTYINGWIRRTYTSADFPEWEIIDSFTPINHFVPYVQAVRSRGVPFKPDIGKVLSVHFIDPRTTNDPVDTPFGESQEGVQVGYDHGTHVWIKYLPACPIFTADPWSADQTYRKGEVRYSPTSGECYSSKANGNRNHDPSLDVSTPRSLSPQHVDAFVPANPGFDASNKIMAVYLTPVSGDTIADPPPLDSTFTIRVLDSAGAEIALETQTADGLITLADILTALTAALAADPDLSTFTVTGDTDALSITFEDASDFTLTAIYSPTGSLSAANYALVISQQKTFIAATAPVEITKQSVTLTLTDQDVRPGAVYTVAFTDADGEHAASYTANLNDSASQILSGLIDEIQDLGADDPTLGSIEATLDVATGKATFFSPQQLGVDAVMAVQGSLWWDLVPFPFELIDAVVRGANADVLKEWSQNTAGMAEEQGVPTEVAQRLSVGDGQQFTQLVERQKTKSRYVLR